MEKKTQYASCEEARQLGLVAYLAQLGHHPVQVRNHDNWYLSPLREEKTPSFKVNQKLNRWYDHGLGQGGNLVDFGILYYGCTVREFLQRLKGNHSAQLPVVGPEEMKHDEKESPITILRARPLWSFFLGRYLQQRAIPPDLAKRYCQEVTYRLNGKDYLAIGFKNDAGGYELRHPAIKISSSPKGITTLDNGAAEVAVFEGFFDFLSYLKILPIQAQNETDFLVLNSVAFFQKARPFLEQHQEINLYLDRDAAGQNVIRKALEISSQYRDKSALYQPCKDLNEWVVSQGKAQKKSLKIRLQ